MKKMMALMLILVMTLGLVGCNNGTRNTVEDEVEVEPVVEGVAIEDTEDDVVVDFENVDGFEVIDNIDNIDTPDSEYFIVDPDTGEEYYNNLILITTDPSITADELTEVLTEFDIQVEPAMSGLGLYNGVLHQTYTLDELNELIAQLSEIEIIQDVSKVIATETFDENSGDESVEVSLPEEVETVVPVNTGS